MRKELDAVRKFYSLISRRFTRRGVLLFAMLFFSSALLLPFPFLTKVLFDDVILNPDKALALRDLFGIAVFLLFLQLLDSVFMYFLEISRTQFDNDLTIYIRTLLTEKLAKAKESFFQKTDFGTIFHRITDDVEESQGVLFDGVAFAVIDIAKLVFGIGAMLFLSVPMTVLALSVIPFYVLAVQRTGTKLEKQEEDIVKKRGTMYDFFFEYIRSVHLVKMYVVSRFENRRLDRKMQSYSEDVLRFTRTKSLLDQVVEFIGSIGPLLVLVYGCEQIIEGKLTVGALVAFTEFVPYAFDSANGLVTFNIELTKAYPSMHNLFKVLDFDEEIQLGDLYASLNTHDVVFENVHVSVNGKKILDSVSFHVPQGSTVAIVGPSGSGKSSILRLIEGFWYPDSGRVLVGGADTARADIRSVRNDIGYVSQETLLLKGTIRENISLGKRMDLETVRHYARLAKIDDVVQKLPLKYDTVVDPESTNFSGGQMQRMSLARALAQEKKILLLDEFSSELDPSTEHKILMDLSGFRGQKTMIIVTHNERCVKNADGVLVIKHGKLVERGTYASLSGKPHSEFNQIFRFGRGKK